MMGWLFSGVGLGLLIIAFGMSGLAGGLILICSLIILGIGLSAAAGYQVIARGSRSGSAYRGPSPLILFGLQLVFVNLLSGALLFIGLPHLVPDSVNFVITGAVLLLGYVLVTWVFVVRTKALSWTELGVPIGSGLGRVLSDVGFGALVMLVAWPFILALLAVLSTLLGTVPPQVVPPPQSAGDFVLTFLAAAVMVPIGEELFFRGVTLTAWLRDRGARSALIRSALFFALVHALNVTAAPTPEGASEGVRQAVLLVTALAPVGFVLGWLFLRRGLVAAIAGHATFNGIQLVILYLAQSLPAQPPT